MFRKLFAISAFAALPLVGCGVFESADMAAAVVRIPKPNAAAATFAPAAADPAREWYRVSVTGPGMAPVAVTGEVDGAAVRLTELEPGTPRYFTAELFSDGALTRKTYAGVSGAVTLLAGETAKVTIDVRSIASNRPPTLASATIAQETYYTDSVITCVPEGFADLDGDAPQYHFTWLVNGADAGGDDAKLSGDSFAKGDTVRCRATPFDGVAEGKAVESNEVVIANSAPTVGVAFTNGPYSVSTPLTPAVSPFDADGDAVSLTYTWAIGAEPQMVTTPTFPAGAAIRGQTVTVTVVASDGVATSPAVSKSVTIANAPPTLQSAVLSNTAPDTNGSLTVTAGATADADGDQVSLKYQWYKNDVPIQGQTLPSLNGNDFDRGDVVYVLVWPNDGVADGLAVSSDSAVVVNTPPTMSSVSFTPQTVYETSVLSPNPAGFFDVDGDAPAYAYVWFVDGISVSTSFSIDGALFDKGNNVWVEVKPFDGYAFGAAVTSPGAVVQNSKPYISWAYFQQPLYTDTTAEIGLTVGDADLGDTLTYEYQYTVDATAVTGWQGVHLLSGTFFYKGQVVTASVRIHDGTEYSDVVSVSTTVLNSRPTSGAYSLSPAEARGGLTTLSVVTDTTAIDADGDAITYTVDWYKNGVMVASGSPLSYPVQTAALEQWYAVVTTFDGDEASDPSAPTNTLTIAQAAKSVAVGYAIACAITESDDLECWGEGHLGRGTFEQQTTPVKVTAFAGDVSAVSVGTSNACAIKTDGTLWCWGWNSNGEAGQGTAGTAVVTPTQVAGYTFRDVSVGDSHVCGITSGNLPVCWGRNAEGQLGLGNTTNYYAPVSIASLGGVKDIDAGNQRTCAVNLSGSVYCWGQDPLPSQGINRTSPVLVSIGTTAEKVSTGLTHSCALSSQPDVRCWGMNLKGQLGDGTTTRPGSVVTVNLGGDVPVDVAAGSEFTCAVTNNGAKCWGENLGGSLGNGTGTSALSPVMVALPLTQGFPQQVDAGRGAVCASYADGALYCWGFNENSVLGRGVSLRHATPVQSEMGVEKLAAYGGNVCVVDTGDTWCWGANGAGQLGFGVATDYVWDPAMSSAGTAPAEAAAIGSMFMCTLRTDATVWCSGLNDDGQTGNGTLGGTVLSATKVPGLAATAISLGSSHACAVRTDGKAACWGKNDQGQLGLGAAGASVTSPTEVPGLSGVVAVSAGQDHTCAVTSTGALYCWGDNSYGAIGDSSTVDRPSPVQIFANGIQQVVASQKFTCAIASAGDVWCWGYGSQGNLGNGLTSHALSPTPVSSGLQAKALASTGYFVCAIDLGDDVYCWGSNMNGEVGSLAGNVIKVPTGPVVQDVTLLAAATEAACAFKPLEGTYGTLSCWGNNNSGQLHDTSMFSPETVLGYWSSALPQ